MGSTGLKTRGTRKLFEAGKENVLPESMTAVETGKEEYEVSARGYLRRAIELREGGGRQNLFYAAFELRCALERTLIDYLALLIHPDDPSTLLGPKIYKPKAVMARVREVDPEFEQRLHFTSLLMRAYGRTNSETRFDFDWVCNAHESLDKYLHHQKDPTETVDDEEWMAQLEADVDNTRERLLSMWRANRTYLKESNLQDDPLYQLYKSGKYTDDEIIGMLRLSDK